MCVSEQYLLALCRARGERVSEEAYLVGLDLDAGGAVINVAPPRSGAYLIPLGVADARRDLWRNSSSSTIDFEPGATLSFYTVIDCHRLPFLRDLPSNLAIIAVILCHNDSAGPG